MSDETNLREWTNRRALPAKIEKLARGEANNGALELVVLVQRTYDGASTLEHDSWSNEHGS